VGLVLYIGISLFITGIFLIAAALSLRKVEDNWGWRLAEGIIDLLFAFVLLANPGISAATIPFVVGFWMMVTGVIIFINSFGAKKEGVPEWWLGLISGILTVLIGYFITANVLAGAIAVTMWIGIGFLIAGFVTMGISFRMRKAYKATAD
jgi:uncharacterized membrane protein HdeD (DUF308 family)